MASKERIIEPEAAPADLVARLERAEAILNVRKGSFVTRPQEIEQDKLLYIQPETIRLIRLPV